MKGFRARDLGAALVWTGAWAVLAGELSVVSATWAAAAGGLTGYYGGSFLAKTRLRAPAVFTLAPVLLFLAVLAGRIPSTSPTLAGALGASTSFFLSSALVWFCLALTGTGVLHFVTTRYPAWVATEVAVVTAFLAIPFAAHRDGFVNRPHFLVDPLWSRGYDPMPFLFALGAIAGAIVILLTLGRVTKRSSALDLAILLAVIACLYLYLPENTIRDWIPDPPGGLGLTGDPRDGEPRNAPGGAGGMGQGEGEDESDQNDEIPFQDNYNVPDTPPRPVAVVILRDDYTPPYGFYYFRQSAYSQFNGRRLIADTTGLADQDLATYFPVEQTTLGTTQPDPQTHKLLGTRVALISSHTNPFGLVNAAYMKPAPNPNPENFQRAYDVESWALTADYRALVGRQIGGSQWPPELLEHYTDLPEDTRYREMAEEIIADLPEEYREDPLAWVVAIKLWLDKNGVYSLRSNHMSAGDPVASFLFGNKTGYCVHFAHAGCYLFRSLGIPSRVAAGYATDARFRKGSAILLRDRESHAWPEVYFEGLGWVVIDFAIENSLVPPVAQPDPDLSKLLGELARDEEERIDLKPKKSLRQILQELSRLLGYLALLAGALLVLAAVGMKLIRRLEARYVSNRRCALFYYRTALDTLADAGIYRGHGQGRFAFAEEHELKFPSLMELTRLHQQATMGDPERRPDLKGWELHKIYKSFCREVARAVPWWRRALGWLNPFTWLWVK